MQSDQNPLATPEAPTRVSWPLSMCASLTRIQGPGSRVTVSQGDAAPLAKIVPSCWQAMSPLCPHPTLTPPYTVSHQLHCCTLSYHHCEPRVGNKKTKRPVATRVTPSIDTWQTVSPQYPYHYIYLKATLSLVSPPLQLYSPISISHLLPIGPGLLALTRPLPAPHRGIRHRPHARSHRKPHTPCSCHQLPRPHAQRPAACLPLSALAQRRRHPLARITQNASRRHQLHHTCLQLQQRRLRGRKAVRPAPRAVRACS